MCAVASALSNKHVAVLHVWRAALPLTHARVVAVKEACEVLVDVADLCCLIYLQTAAGSSMKNSCEQQDSSNQHEVLAAAGRFRARPFHLQPCSTNDHHLLHKLHY
jgi:hypothetical protein